MCIRDRYNLGRLLFATRVLPYINKEEVLIDRLIDLAFAEDIGDGDHTTLSCIPATAMGKSKLLIKEALSDLVSVIQISVIGKRLKKNLGVILEDDPEND